MRGVLISGEVTGSTHLSPSGRFPYCCRSERVGGRIKYPYRKSGLRNCIATNRVATAAGNFISRGERKHTPRGERAVSLSSMSATLTFLSHSGRARYRCLDGDVKVVAMQFSLLGEHSCSNTVGRNSDAGFLPSLSLSLCPYHDRFGENKIVAKSRVKCRERSTFDPLSFPRSFPLTIFLKFWRVISRERISEHFCVNHYYFIIVGLTGSKYSHILFFLLSKFF